jgi:hypothetical protein
MPLIRIDAIEGRSKERGRGVPDAWLWRWLGGGTDRLPTVVHWLIATQCRR